MSSLSQPTVTVEKGKFLEVHNDEAERHPTSVNQLPPNFRFKWDNKEVPVCILGSADMCNMLVHLVRILGRKEKNMFKKVLENPFTDNPNKLRIVPNAVMKKKFPQIVIQFYELNKELVEDAKSDEEKKIDVRNALCQKLETDEKEKLLEKKLKNIKKKSQPDVDIFGLPHDEKDTPSDSDASDD